eukprot:420316-Prymnesium_polylepis.1
MVSRARVPPPSRANTRTPRALGGGALAALYGSAMAVCVRAGRVRVVHIAQNVVACVGNPGSIWGNV